MAVALAERHRCGIARVTPAGFPIVVAYTRQTSDRHTRTQVGTKRERLLVLRVADPDGGIDKERQKRTIATAAALEALRATIPAMGDPDLDEVPQARYMFA